MNQRKRDLVVKHSSLVDEVFPVYRGRGVEDDDVRQEGFLGLCDAAERSDPQFTDSQFRAYASWWICYAMARAIHRRGLVNRSRSERALYSACIKAVERLVVAGNARPTREEIAEACGYPISLVDAAFGFPGRAEFDVSLFASKESTRHDGEIYDAIEASIVALAKVEWMAAEVVIAWFGIGGGSPQTRLQIARSHAITPAEVSRQKEVGLKFIRSDLIAQGFKPATITTAFERRVA